MKFILKTSTKIVLFCFALTLVNCERDDFQDSETNVKKEFPFTFKKKTYAELNTESKFVNALDEVLKLKGSDSSFNAKTVMENQYGFTIDSTLIKEVTSENYTSYSFLIHRETVNQSFFENLVVTVDSTLMPKAYILKHNLNSQPIYINEDEAYSLDAQTEITLIDFNDSAAKVSYNIGCTIITLMCPFEGDHPAGDKCINAKRGNLYWSFDFSNCGSSDEGSGVPVDGSSGTPGGYGNSSDDSSDADFSMGCRGCVDSGGIIIDPVFPEEIDDCVLTLKGNLANLGLSDEQICWLNKAAQATLKETLKQFLNDSNTLESQAFATVVIEASVNGSIITVFPFIKYPVELASEYRENYPYLTEYLKYQLPTVSEIPLIVNTIHSITDLSIEQIKEDLKWGNGPELHIVQLDDFGENTSETTVGFFRVIDPNKIYLDIDYVNGLENGTTTQYEKEALLFYLGTTILHEYVHYGDNTDGVDYPGEEGQIFEILVYGENVTSSNAALILKGN